MIRDELAPQGRRPVQVRRAPFPGMLPMHAGKPRHDSVEVTGWLRQSPGTATTW